MRLSRRAAGDRDAAFAEWTSFYPTESEACQFSDRFAASGKMAEADCCLTLNFGATKSKYLLGCLSPILLSIFQIF